MTAAPNAVLQYWLRRAPDGVPICRVCGKRMSRAYPFCSDECEHKWRLRTDERYRRAKVFARDKGFCAVCGRDTVRAEFVLRSCLRRAAQAVDQAPTQYHTPLERITAVYELATTFMAEAGLPPVLPPGSRRSLWDVVLIDHKKAGKWELDNMMTLCWWCKNEQRANRRRERVQTAEWRRTTAHVGG